MTKKRKAKISNDIPPQKLIAGVKEETINSEIYKQWDITFDLSFRGCFYSIDEKEFNNCFKNTEEFVQMYKNCMITLHKLSGHTIYELLSNKSFRHCHEVKKEDEKKAYKIIKKLCEKVELSESYFEQNVGSEKIYQIGFEDSVRIFGTIRANIFRVFFIDYFHHFYFDEGKNERNIKNYNFFFFFN